MQTSEFSHANLLDSANKFKTRGMDVAWFYNTLGNNGKKAKKHVNDPSRANVCGARLKNICVHDIDKESSIEDTFYRIRHFGIPEPQIVESSLLHLYWRGNHKQTKWSGGDFLGDRSTVFIENSWHPVVGRVYRGDIDFDNLNELTSEHLDLLLDRVGNAGVRERAPAATAPRTYTSLSTFSDCLKHPLARELHDSRNGRKMTVAFVVRVTGGDKQQAISFCTDLDNSERKPEGQREIHRIVNYCWSNFHPLSYNIRNENKKDVIPPVSYITNVLPVPWTDDQRKRSLDVRRSNRDLSKSHAIMMRQAGKDNTEIGKLLKVNPRTVRRWLNE